jgi:hypothetical protein
VLQAGMGPRWGEVRSPEVARERARVMLSLYPLCEAPRYVALLSHGAYFP